LIKIKTSLVYSLLIHALLLAILIVPCMDFLSHSQIGNIKKTLDVTIEQPYWFRSKRTLSLQKNGSSHLNKLIMNRPSRNISGQYRQLALFLHDQLQSRLINLQNILSFSRTLMIEVSFTVIPNGNIKNVSLLKKSGVEFIDNETARTIQTIKIPETMLPKRKENFNLKIILDSGSSPE